MAFEEVSIDFRPSATSDPSLCVILLKCLHSSSSRSSISLRILTVQCPSCVATKIDRDYVSTLTENAYSLEIELYPLERGNREPYPC